MVSGTQSCGKQCYSFFIDPFKQGAYNLHDAVKGKKIEKVAYVGLILEAPPAKSIPLAERVSRAVIGILLIIPIINFIAMAILKGIQSEFLYGFGPVQPAPIEEAEPDEPAAAIPLTPEQMIARKMEALTRLDQIEQMIPEGSDSIAELTSHFRCKQHILRFSLDGLLEQYQTDENPSKLLEFMDWALEGFQPEEGEGELRRLSFQVAIHDYEEEDNTSDHHVQNTAIRNILKNLVAYFDQERVRVDVGAEDREDDALEAEEAVKAKFREVCRKIIDANNNCADQMLSQLQEIAVDVLAEGATSQGNSTQREILAQARLVLCRYRTNLLREILARQNPDERHMADLERVVFQRVTERLGLQGAIFQAGAVYERLAGDIEGRVERAIEAFREEYKPTQYLLEQLRTNLGEVRTFRNNIPNWANDHYNLGEEDPQGDERQPHEMDRRLSEVNFAELPEEDRDNPAIMSAGEGGNFTPASTAFLLEALGLIVEV